jgi:TRAP-type uncharacterized transport system substrate-binding protein
VPKTITMTIQGKGSSTIHDAQVIADLLKESTGDVLKLIPEDDWQLRFSWIRESKVDFFYEGSTTPVRFEGKDPADLERNRGPFRMQVVASAHSGATGFMVRADSKIKTIYDITPKTRVAVSQMGGDLMYALMAWLKLNKGPVPENLSDGKWNTDIQLFDTWEANLRSVGEGKADVAAVTPENPIIKQMALKSPGIRFLNLPAKEDPEGFKRFRKALPNVGLATAPQEGASEIWGLTTMVGTACIWCRPDFDVETAYTLTKWLDINYPLYKDKGNKLRTYTLECLKTVADTALAPVHEGTVKYFREKKLWSPANELRQAYNLKVQDRYCDAWKNALAKADATGVQVSSTNPAWLKLWQDLKKDLRLPPIRLMTDGEIADAMKATGGRSS